MFTRPQTLDRSARRQPARWPAILCAGAFFAAAPAGHGAPAVAPGIEQAVLRGDWGTVAMRVDSARLPLPVAQLLRAHAQLALNRNDESACGFAGADGTALSGWEQWTAAFSAEHRGEPVAHYLRGDALARRARWAEAIEAFTSGLARDGRNPLLLNARGVALAMTRQWDAAVVDFDEATRARVSFADAYANKGVVTLLRGSDPRAAVKAFDRALEESEKGSPNFALAQAGRASAKAVLKDTATLQRELSAAGAGSDCRRSLMAEEAKRVLLAIHDRAISAVAAIKGDPGTTLSAMLGEVAEGNIGRMRDVITLTQGDPVLQRGAVRQIDAMSAANPELGRRIEAVRNADARWNAPTGPLNLLVSALGGLSANASLSASRGVTNDVTHGGSLPGSQGPITRTTSQASQGSVTGGVGIAWSASGLADQAKANAQSRWEAANSLAGASALRNAAGADTEQEDSMVSPGDFPVLARFGLLYRDASTASR